MKILYINHVNILGGASRSLIELLAAFPEGKIKPHVISPKGDFANHIKKLGFPIINTIGLSQFDNTEYSYYNRLRWIVLFREIILLFSTITVLIKAKKIWNHFDIIHINEITMLPVVVIAKIIFNRSKIVVHARSVQRKKSNLRLFFFNLILKNFSSLIIPIDKNVELSLSDSMQTTIIHNGLSLKNKNKNKNKNKKFVVGLVGLIHKSKGCLIFVRAAAICKKQGYKIQFNLYGHSKVEKETYYFKFLKFFNLHQDITAEVKNLIISLKLESMVKLKKFTKNLDIIYEEQDILCFPSLLKSPGRPVFEAGFYKVPTIAAIPNPCDDTFIDKKTGITVKTMDYKDLAEKIMYLFDNDKIRKQMGQKAFELANKNFGAQNNAKKVLIEYRKLILLN